MKRIPETYPFFLVLLPAFVVVHLEKELQGVIPYQFVYDRIIIFFCIPLLLSAIFLVFFRNYRKAALFAFAASLFFFFLGDIKNSLSENHPGSLIQKYSFLFSASLVVLVIVFILLKKNKSGLRKTCLLINTGMLLFIMADLLIILSSNNRNRYHMDPVTLTKTSPCDSCNFPDIYYIIFDAYTSSPELQRDFNYSNQYIDSSLQAKGFRIIPGSRSNYNYTAFSLSSVFNMSYFADADTTNKVHDREYLQALKTVYTNKVFPFFEQAGYDIANHSLFHIKHYPSTRNKKDMWGIRELFDQYNIFLKFNYDAGFNLPAWLNKTFTENAYFVNDINNRHFIDSMVKRDLLNTLYKRSAKPKFVYAHFLTTHPPFLVDSLGNKFQSPGSYAPGDIRDGYINQVARSNRIIQSITDSILTYTRRPLIIILQGDHGYTFENDPLRKPQKMFPNLNAVYFSSRDYHMLSDSLTNVNTFRVVLDTWFKKDLPILQDKFYYIK